MDPLQDRELLAPLLDAISALVVVLDREGRIVRFNPASEELSGYRFEEVRGRVFWEFLLPPGNVERVRGAFQRMVAGEARTRGENEWLTKGGELRLTAWSNTVVRDGAGNVEYVLGTGLDITGRRRTEQALEDSEAWSRGLYESMRDACAIVNMDGRIRDFNELFCVMLGYEREDLLTRTYEDITPDRWHAFKAGIIEGQVLARGYSDVYEKEYRRKDGTVFPVELRAVLLRDHAGAPTGMWATVRDVSERKRIEQTLRASEAKCRAVIEQASDGITLTDPEWRFLDANPRACEMFGYSREELARMSVRDIGVPEDLSTHALHDEELRRGGTILTERSVRRKDGTIFAAEISARGLPNGSVVSVVRDITERRRIEEALRESEARYRALFEHATDSIVLTDGDLQILDANPRACEMLGYTRDELLRMSARDLPVPEDVAAHPLEIERWNRAQSALTRRALRRKDGSAFIAETHASRLPDDRVLAVFHDVTEQERADQALRESEERFRRVFESDMMGMLFGLHGGAVTGANDYFLRLLDFTRDDLLAGRVRWNVVSPPEFAHVIEEAVRQAHETGTSKPFETEFVRRDGTRVPVLCGAAFVGEARDFGVAFALDLTELRRAEQRLAESERYLERAQELAQVGTWDADLTTMIATFSDEMLRIYGRPPGGHAVRYAEFIASVHPDDRPAVERSIRRTIEHPGEQRFEHRLIRPDGTVRMVESTSESVPDASGRSARIIGSVQDITERRFLELQLREAQRLESIGRLAGGVAHDFNNLLTVILGFTETLLEGLSAGDERRASAEQIRAAGRRAADLTQQLLAFGRRQVLRMKVFDLNAVLLEMRDILQRLAGGQIEVVLSPGARQCLVKADRGQIEQVILNLVLNARDAMPAGGRLEIVTGDMAPAVGEQAGPAGRWLQLAVSDTGTGMSPELQAHIFEPFFTTKEVGQGTGLGLATVHGIVTQMGGRIEVNSAPGEGTTFRVLLPCAAANADREEAAPTPVLAESRGEETVLLVEDESAVRGFIAEALRSRGYRVIEAADGDQAIDAAHGHGGVIHLLLTDLVMPGMTGRELARFMAHERPGLRVLFISGYSDERTESRDSEGGPEAFLQKPFTPVVLARQVRQVLDAPGSGPGPSGN
jgi:two-component system cell cycle sensor histidine kinase/response regulator CckA